MKKSIVIIPALNEAESLKKLLPKIDKTYDVLVVNDGSIDETEMVATRNGAFVLNNSQNRGYENAIDRGLDYASVHSYNKAIVIDADGQHNPDLLSKFFEALDSKIDLVCGDRDKSQRFGEVIFRFFGRLFLGINDPLCGMRAYSMNAYNRIGYFDLNELVGVEYLIQAKRNKFKIINIKISTLERDGPSRFGEGIKTEYKILKALLKSMKIYFFN